MDRFGIWVGIVLVAAVTIFVSIDHWHTKPLEQLEGDKRICNLALTQLSTEAGNLRVDIQKLESAKKPDTFEARWGSLASIYIEERNSTNETNATFCHSCDLDLDLF